MDYILHLVRLHSNSKQTVGIMFIVDSKFKLISWCNCLELPDLSNKKNESQIPAGTYQAFYEKHEKYGKCYRVHGVSGRDGILIHVGNFYYQTKGCILVGTNLRDVDKDGNLDVCNSRIVMNELYELLPMQFTIVIR